MHTTHREEVLGSWLQKHAHVAAILITLLGLVARLWWASGTFLNPDEALHFRVANQPSLLLTYKESLTNSHPPLLFFLLHFWRLMGVSEVWLRLPSVVAGAVFCWMFYKWLTKAAGKLVGMIGLLLAGLLLPIVLQAAEVRQYALLSAFLAGAIYLLDEAFEKKSSARITAFTVCLCLALLSQYSAALVIVALGFYALFRISTERPPRRIVVCWSIGQLAVLSLAIFLDKTHLSRLVGGNDSALHGWLRDYIRSYYNPARDNPIAFVAGHSFGIFQYFFGQLAVGDVMGLLFLIAVVLLLRGKGTEGVQSARRLGLFLLLSFVIAATASLFEFYPYGGTRHMAFLMIPALAGVSVAIAWLASGRWAAGVGIACLILVACLAFGKPRQPRMERVDQSRAHMADAVGFIQKNIDPRNLIFTDYQTDLVLGHYLCQQRPIALEAAPASFEQFSCGGHHVVSMDFRGWMFVADTFAQDWQRFVQACRLKPGDTVWIIQAGWGADLPEGLRRQPQFHDLRFDSFGKNIKIFKMTVGQPMPAAGP